MSRSNRKSRTLLTDYYGLQTAVSPEHHNTSDEEDFGLSDDFNEGAFGADNSSNDPLDRDDFQLEPFVRDVISTNTVKQLIELDNNVIGQIRALDNDLQMLVYENYAKFIAATDVIKEMQIKVDNLHVDMSKLRSTIDTLGNYYTAAEKVIDPSRSRIEKLLGLSRLVSRLNFLFDLPNRLKAAISKQNYAKVVSVYLASSKILAQYKHVKSFQEIQKESESILKEFRISLRSKLQHVDYTKGSEQIDIAALLLKLGEEPALLWHDILCAKRDRVLINLEKAKKSTTSTAHLLKSLRMSFVDEFLEFAIAFKSLFLDALPSSPSPNSPQQTGKKVTPVSRTVQDDALTALSAFTRQVYALYLEDARAVLVKLVEEGSECGSNSDEHRRLLEVIVNEIKSISDMVENAQKLVPSAQLTSRSKEITENVIKRIIISVFSRSQEQMVQVICLYLTRESSGQSDVADCVKQIHENLKSASLDVSLICNYHPQPDRYIQDLFLEALENLQTLLLGDNGIRNMQAALHITPNQYRVRKSLLTSLKTVTPAIFFRLSKLCLSCQRFVLPELFEFLAGLFPALSSSLQFNRKCATLVQLFKETEKGLMNAAARCAGVDLSRLLAQGKIAAQTPPTRPSDWVPVWQAALSSLQQQLLATYPDTPAEPPSVIGRRPVSPSRPMRRNDIHRMLSQAHTAPIFSFVEPNLESLLHSAVKIALKSWIEYVRVNTFTALQFQQIQVDVFAVRAHFPVYLHQHRSILDSLLDEVLTSTMDMCCDPSPELPAEFVERFASPQ